MDPGRPTTLTHLVPEGDSLPRTGANVNKVTITLFTMPGCPYCDAGRLFLGTRGVPFVERSVAEDVLATPDLLFLTGRDEVPTLIAGYQASVGFDPPRWEEVLEHARAIEREDPLRLPPMFGPDTPSR